MNKQNTINVVIQLTVEKYALQGALENEFGHREISYSNIDLLIEELQENVEEVLKDE